MLHISKCDPPYLADGQTTLTMEVNKLVEHLFRHESGRIVAALARIFGPGQLEMAEDVVQESLAEAIDTWPYGGIPENPSGWLFRVARNKALNLVKRDAVRRRIEPDLARLLESEWTREPTLNHAFSEPQIQDGQLRMLFVCCHPSLSPDSQVALALKILGGFSIEEIARAFLSKYDTINRRLVRARKQLKKVDVPFDVPLGPDWDQRVDSVLETIYLMFNEGYQAISGDEVIRYDLCLEAIRLGNLLANDPRLRDAASVHALLALMILNVSRFRARTNADGGPVDLAEQDRTLWDASLMARGFDHLERASTGESITKYHILAAISACHCSAPVFEQTDWSRILTLYDHLLVLDASPMVRLGRAVAVRYASSPQAALRILASLENDPILARHHLLHATKAALLSDIGEVDRAATTYRKAIALCPSGQERKGIEARLERLSLID